MSHDGSMDSLKAHLLFDMYRSFGGPSRSERGDLVAVLDGNEWIYGGKDSKMRKKVMNLVTRWKALGQALFQQMLVQLGLTLLPLLAPRGCDELPFALTELAIRPHITLPFRSSSGSNDAVVNSKSKSSQPTMKFTGEAAKKAVEDTTEVDKRNVGVKPKSIDDVQLNLEVYEHNDDGVVNILPTIYITKAHMPLGDWKVVKVDKRESLDGSLQFKGWSIFKDGCLVTIVDKHRDTKLYSAHLQPDKHTVWVYLPASNGMETTRDQIEGKVEETTQDALDATHGLQEDKHQEYVVQPFWFPDKLSIRYIKEEIYEDTRLPSIPIPLRLHSEEHPSVYLDLMQIEWNAVIEGSGKQLGHREVLKENPIYTRLRPMLPTSVASTSVSAADPATAAPTTTGVPTNISTFQTDDASTNTALRRSRRISNRHPADISVIGEDMEL